MMKKMIVVLTTVLLLTNCREIRLLQGWSDPNCSEWSDDGLSCLKCSIRAYFDADQQLCIRVDDNCKTWSQTNGQCLTCYDSYGDSFYNGNAVDGKCLYFNGTEPTPQPPQPPFVYDINCQCYSNQRVCLSCFETFSFDSQGICQPSSGTCRRSGNGVCLECQDGYYLDSQGLCNLLPANCTKADTTGVCVQCLEGFYLTPEGQCLLAAQNCATIGSDGLCLQCNDGYYLDETGQCNFLPNNCNATDTQGLCIECLEGYFLDEQRQCEILPENCFFTDNNGICTECLDGFYVDLNKECTPLAENCLAADQKGQCTQCLDGFQPVGMECLTLVGQGQPNPNCAAQDKQGKCTQCRTFYKLSVGKCVPTGLNPFCKAGACQCGTGDCLQCQTGYFLDNKKICIVIAQNCEQYSKLNGRCTSCIKDYLLVDGQCVPQVGNIVTNFNCKVQMENGTCSECRKYYKLEEGDCKPTGQNPKCKIWSSQKICQCCYYPGTFYLDNNFICEQRNQFCSQFNPQSGNCTQCLSEYTLTEGKCMA